MKIALISVLSSDDPSQNGVWGKMCAIQSAFNNLSHECDLFHLSSKGVCRNNQTIVQIAIPSKKKYIFIANNYLPLIEGNLNTYDVVWIRHAIYSKSILDLLKLIKTEKPNTKVFYELPTYPYINEFKGLKKIAILLHEKTIMSSLHKSVDKVLTYSLDDVLFNVPTIKIGNGIDASSYPMISTINTKAISFIAIGKLWNWYGLDRLILGLKDYLNSKLNIEDVSMYIIGGGEQERNLQHLVLENSLENHVTFLGWKSKEEIDKLSFSNPIGVGTLAIHRKKVILNSSLKHREYASRAVPFFYAGNDLDFTKDCSFVMACEANDSAIEIKSIVDWYKTLPQNKEYIKRYAEEKLDWKIKVNQILQQL